MTRAGSAGALTALTAAALALPGLAAGATQGFEFEYGRYVEGGRDLAGERSQYHPIRVDNLALSGDVSLRESLTLHLAFSQDTWSGATPAATAPLAMQSNRGSLVGDTTSGASPFVYGNFLVDKTTRTPYVLVNTPTSFNIVPDQRVVHTMSSASPETRRGADFNLNQEFGDYGVSLGGGLSSESDFESRYGSLALRADFDHKRTTATLKGRYSSADVAANIDGGAFLYFDSSAYRDSISFENSRDSRAITLRDDRADWSVAGSLARVVNKHLVIENTLEFTRSDGFLENPYKLTQFLFFAPDQQGIDFGLPGVPLLYNVDARALIEQRPDIRRQWSWHSRMALDLQRLDAALHAGYRLYHDDWDITAHTFDLEWIQRVRDGWHVSPRVRYYSQGRADFYHPYVVVSSAVQLVDLDPQDPSLGFREDFSGLPLKYFSSDHRLSGFGAISAGVSIARETAGGALRLETGVEYYSHAGRLKIGGGGERAFADYDGYLLNASLKLDFERRLLPGPASHRAPHHTHHPAHGAVPAGIEHGHRLQRAGEFMLGYRYSYGQWSGDMLHGAQATTRDQQLKHACGAVLCSQVPREMSMNMHMVDVMFAPTEWLTLMVMPQFVDMNMSFERLRGGPPPSGHQHGGGDTHASGGVGDTEFGALLRVFERAAHSAHVGLGMSAPSGDYDVRHGNMRLGDYLHYDMQLGSGSWDLVPSATYLGHHQRWSWGAQLTAIVRLEEANGAGYRLGNRLSTSLWSGYALSEWLSVTLRGSYTVQGGIQGAFKPAPAVSGPMDLPDNSGRRYWEMGAGLTTEMPHGALAGNRVSVEWLAPLAESVNGYQRARAGTLFASWSVSL